MENNEATSWDIGFSDWDAMVSQVLVSANEKGMAGSMIGSLVVSLVLFSAVWHDRGSVMGWSTWGDL